jgi:rubrerythrin
VSGSRHYVTREPRHDHRRILAQRLGGDELEFGLVEYAYDALDPTSYGAWSLTLRERDARTWRGRGRRRNKRERRFQLVRRLLNRVVAETRTSLVAFEKRYGQAWRSTTWATVQTDSDTADRATWHMCMNCAFVVSGDMPARCPACCS